MAETALMSAIVQLTQVFGKPFFVLVGLLIEQ